MTLKNPFKTFGIPVSFNINEQNLEEKFIEMQKTYHPDSNTSDAQKSLEITEGYYVLKDDLSRGVAIMDLFGINQDTFHMPPNFFPEIMEVTELMQEMPKQDAKNIALKARSAVVQTGEISQENSKFFAELFIRYKYLKKAFINAHGSW